MTSEPATAAGCEPGIDVLALAGQLPSGPAWLWVTEAGPQPGATFTACLPGPGPRAFGGDVLIRLAAGASGPGVPAAVSAGVWAVAAGHLVLVAAWDQAGPGDWPEQVRPAVTFVMGALTALGEHADLRELGAVSLDDAGTAAPGFPPLDVYRAAPPEAAVIPGGPPAGRAAAYVTVSYRRGGGITRHRHLLPGVGEEDLVGRLRPLLEAGMLTAGDQLTWLRRGRGVMHTATVLAGGAIRVNGGEVYLAPAAAAGDLAGYIQKGWNDWRRADGTSLQELRIRL
jgi:Restriction Enzyme Adenine Methylase Associated